MFVSFLEISTRSMEEPRVLPPDPLQPHALHMRHALQLAATAYERDEVPVGAIVVQHTADGDRVIGEGFNQRETLQDPTAHAEMIAMTQAAATIGDWRLERTTLYVTLEPCPMCAGGIVNARVPKVVFGTTDPKGGACGTLFDLTGDPRLNHRASVLGGVLQDDCRDILQRFFRQQRTLGKK